jgi:phosphohistidine phosphatase
MARQLWLLRHGEAEPHDSAPDGDRRLTARGEAQSRAAGRALTALGLEFQMVFTSPKVRARETARLVCAALAAEPIEHEALSEGFEGSDALELMAAAGEDKRILLIGHEPDLSQVVHDLTGGRVALKKGGLAGIALDRRSGALVALLRPRELDRIAAAAE